MTREKRLFAPLPLRAMASDLSGLQMRVLTCVAAHDRMSLVTGKGQGCRASNDRMCCMVGCNYSRLCSTLSELVELGFLQREKLGRHTVYRVIHTQDDELLFSNASFRPRTRRTGGERHTIACPSVTQSGVFPPKTSAEYIPLNGGIHTVETGEKNSSEDARLAARAPAETRRRSTNIGGELAQLERRLKAGELIDRATYDYLDEIMEHPPDQKTAQWAFRLSEKYDWDADFADEWLEERNRIARMMAAAISEEGADLSADATWV